MLINYRPAAFAASSMRSLHMPQLPDTFRKTVVIELFCAEISPAMNSVRISNPVINKFLFMIVVFDNEE